MKPFIHAVAGGLVLGLLTGLWTPALAQSTPLINEFVVAHAGTDSHEFVEVFGDPNTDYSSFTILEIEGDTATGTIDRAHPIGTTDSSGYFLAGFFDSKMENGTLTLLLVENFTGSTGDDLDTDDDGVIDLVPFERIVDDVAVSDGGSADVTYSTSVLGPGFDGNSGTPGGASRIPDGADTDSTGDWLRNDADGEGLPGFSGTPEEGEALNTPGAINEAVDESEPPSPPPPPPPPETCSVDLSLDYSEHTLTLGFDLRPTDPALWSVWLVVWGRVVPVWTVPVSTPMSLSIEIPGFPRVGMIGILTTLTSQYGMGCADWDVVHTGGP